MTVPTLSLRLMRIPVTIIHVIAIGATILRFYIRIRRRNVWWDDGLAGLAALLDTLYLATFWLRNDNAGQSTPDVLNLYIVLNWVQLMLGTTILWFARMSIMLSTTRIVLLCDKLRKFALLMPFVACWLIILSLKIYVCARTNDWHHSKSVQCFLAEPVPTVKISLDFLADAVLFFIPVRALWNVTLTARTRRLVLTTFAASILVTLANIVYITFMLGSKSWGNFLLVAVSAHIEATIALTVCNASVLIPAVYRTYRHIRGKSSSDEESSEDTELTEMSSNYWTIPRFLVRSMETDSDGLGVVTTTRDNRPRFTVSLSEQRPFKSSGIITSSHGNTSAPKESSVST